MTEKKSRNIIILIFACVFLCMLLFNFLTPLISDDFAHLHDSATFFDSLKYLRNNTNGRIFSHFFVYIFLILPKAVFNIVNAVISVAVLFLIFRFCRSDDRAANILLLLVSVFMLWYFMPGFGQVFLWLTGACNYSWGLALDLLVIFSFFRTYSEEKDYFDGKSAIIKIVYFLVAFLMGAWSENGACASIFAIAVFLLLIWAKRKKFPIIYGLLLAASIIGFAVLMSAPSELGGRTADFSSEVSIFNNAKFCLQQTQKFCTALFIIYFVILALSIYCKTDKKVIVSSLVFFFAGLLSIAVFVFAAYLPHRSFFVIICFTIIACLILLRKLWSAGERKLILAGISVMFVLFLFSFVLGAGDILSLYMQSVERERIITNAVASGETNIEFKPYAASGMYPAAYDEELSEDSSFWYNELVAEYYDIDSISAASD